MAMSTEERRHRKKAAQWGRLVAFKINEAITWEIRANLRARFEASGQAAGVDLSAESARRSALQAEATATLFANFAARDARWALHYAAEGGNHAGTR